MKNLPELSIDLIKVAEKSDGVLSELSKEELEQILERYKKFLYLAKKYPQVPLTPTYDIDEMWHLHMLHPQQYYNDCFKLFGQIMGHETSGTKEQLANYSDQTEKIWKEEFGEEYRTELSERLRKKAGKGDTCYNKVPDTCYKFFATCYKKLIETPTI